MKKQYVMLLCFLCFTSFVQAQKINNKDSLSVRQVVDTLFIDRDINNWSLRLFTNYKGQSFILNKKSNTISFRPNNRAGVGFGLGTSKLIIDVAFNLKGQAENVTKRFDLQGSLVVGEHNLVNLYIQRYKGFNVNNNFNEPEIFRDDIGSLSVGFHYLYAFKKISFSSSILKAGVSNGKGKRFISGGVGGFVAYNAFEGNTTLLPGNGIFDENAYLEEFKGVGMGISAGVLLFLCCQLMFLPLLMLSRGLGLCIKKDFQKLVIIRCQTHFYINWILKQE